MKAFHLLSCLTLSACALAVLSGCPAPVEPAEHNPTLLKRAVNRGSDIEVTSNISQINQALSMVKSDNEGKAPATLEEAKAAAKVPADMWVDSVTGKPLAYDPASGTVYRQGAAPNSPPIAGSSPGNMKLPSGGGGF
jgi:hypothetical protein